MILNKCQAKPYLSSSLNHLNKEDKASFMRENMEKVHKTLKKSISHNLFMGSGE